MATLKQRLHRKNASGTYDTIHFESASDVILRPSGRTVEQDLADYLPEVQDSDNVPQSLSKLIIGNTKSYIKAKQLVTKDPSTNTCDEMLLAKQGDVAAKQVRNIYAGTSDIGAGATLQTGDIYLVYTE